MKKHKWQLQSRLKSDAEWIKFPVIPLDDLETLREILWKKYQRNRVPHEHVLEVDALIEAAKRRGWVRAYRKRSSIYSIASASHLLISVKPMPRLA